MLKSTVLTLLCLFVLSSPIWSQTEEVLNSAGLRWHGGFLFAHHPDMRHLTTSHFSAWELNYQRKFSGKKDWHHHYNGPSWGLTGLVFPVLNDQIGSAYALFPYYYLPLNSSERFQLNLKLGAGVGVLTHRFDRIENHKNIAISTRINAALQLGFDFKVKLHDRIDWNTGIFITHFSNGAVQMPNLGLNFLTASTGLSYKFGPEETIITEAPPFFTNSRIRWSLFAGAGLKQGRIGQDELLPAVTVQLLAEKRLSKKFSLAAGTEMNYNRALIYAYESKSLVAGNAAALRGGLLIGTALHFGKMDVIAQMGGYVLDTGLVDGRFFNRFGLRHAVTNRLKVNLTLRTHFAKADHFELGVVYRLSVL